MTAILGRPPLPPNEKRKNRVLYLNDAEYAECKARAKADGLTVAVWMRKRLLS